MCFKVIHRIPGVFLRKCLFFLTPVLFLSSLLSAARSEQITITTYYPSPNGTYDALSVKRFSVGDTNADGKVNASDVPSSSGYLLVADRLGVGTASPSYPLHVAGTAYSTDGMDHAFKTVSGLQDNRTLCSGIYQNSGDGLYNAAGSSLALASWWHVINMHHQHNNGYNAQIAVPLSASPNDIFFRTSGGGTWTEWRKVLSENTSGNVGIGTTSPGAQLDVNRTTSGIFGIRLSRVGGASDANSWYLWNMDGSYGNDFEIWQYPVNSSPSCCIKRLEIQDGGDTVLVPSGGNVGIGVGSPAAKLDVEGDIHSRSPLTWETHYDDVYPSSITTASTSWTTMPGMSLSFTMPAAGKVFVIFSASMCGNSSAGTRGYWRMLLDGSAVSYAMKYNTDAWELDTVELHRVLSVSSGSHSVEIQWRTNSGTLYCPHLGTSGDVGHRTLTVLPLS